MYVVALTGGIGAGKSTVSRMLADRGAAVIDADVLAREVVEPGTDGLREIVDAFGDGVLAPDGSLDRAALGRIVFADGEERKRLEAIVWPKVGVRTTERLAELASTDAIVILDVPLLVESNSATAQLARTIVVVAASVESQLAHLTGRGMDADEARARIAAQAPLSEKLAVADHVIWNDGTMEELGSRVDEVWRALREDAAA